MEAVGSVVCALCSRPPCDAAGEPETLQSPARPDVRKRAGCTQVGWCPIWQGVNVLLSSKPTQQAGLVCLAAPEIYVKKRASDATVGKQPS